MTIPEINLMLVIDVASPGGEADLRSVANACVPPGAHVRLRFGAASSFLPVDIHLAAPALRPAALVEIEGSDPSFVLRLNTGLRAAWCGLEVAS